MSAFAKTRISLLLSFVLCLNSCANVFEPTSNKRTDEALYEDAVKANNTADFDTAIAKILSMSTAKQAEKVTKELLAAAYAGKCGFNFVSFFVAATAGPGTSPFFYWLMSQWTTISTNRTYCKLAETTIKSITPTYLGRSADDSLFMVFLGLAKTGIYLSELVDTDRNGLADNPPYDGSANSFCDCANLGKTDLAEIASGVGIAIANLANVTVSLGSLDIVTLLGPACAGTPSPCAIEDESLILADTTFMTAFRGLLNSTSPANTGLVSGTPTCNPLLCP